MSRPPNPTEAEIDAADAALLFKEPPPATGRYGESYGAVRAALRRHPGEWAVLKESYASPTVGPRKHWHAWGFEITSRRNPKVEGEKSTYTIYVRYVAGVES